MRNSAGNGHVPSFAFANEFWGAPFFPHPRETQPQEGRKQRLFKNHSASLSEWKGSMGHSGGLRLLIRTLVTLVVCKEAGKEGFSNAVTSWDLTAALIAGLRRQQVCLSCLITHPGAHCKKAVLRHSCLARLPSLHPNFADRCTPVKLIMRMDVCHCDKEQIGRKSSFLLLLFLSVLLAHERINEEGGMALRGVKGTETNNGAFWRKIWKEAFQADVHCFKGRQRLTKHSEQTRHMCDQGCTTEWIPLLQLSLGRLAYLLVCLLKIFLPQLSKAGGAVGNRSKTQLLT